MNRRGRPTWCAIAAALMFIGAMDAMSRSPNPNEVIDNPDCKIKTAHGLALLHWPLDESTRFAVLNDTGTLFDGEVPFVPDQRTKIALIKRRDGKVLVAFAKLAYRSKVYGEPDVDAPVRVFLDGKMIYQADKAWQFDVASDGSSFFTIEPSVEATPSLRIHEVGPGVFKRMDLAERFAAHGMSESTEDASHVSAYSSTGDEVVIMPGDVVYEDISGGRYKYFSSNGPGTYLFYSLKHEQWRVLEGEGDTALFPSSRQAYFISRCKHDRSGDGFAIPGSETVITKKEYLWDGLGRPKEVEAWTRTIDLDGFAVLSNDAVLFAGGSLLKLFAANTHVLDTATGETVFAFPTTENLSRTSGLTAFPWIATDFMSEVNRDTPVGKAYHERTLARLRNVMPPDATIDDVNVISGLMVDNGQLVLGQTLYRRKPPDDRSFSYLFDMEGLHVDAKPKFRRENPRRSRDETCRVGADSPNGLRMSGGKLIYQSMERSAHAD